jgi:hypothetical protein
MMSDVITSPHSEDILNALQYQGSKNDCGPFTMATVINTFTNAGIEAEQLASQMNKPRWRGPLPVIRRIPNWATLPWGMVDVFQEYGLQASWRILASIAHLRDGIIQGDILMPILASYQPLWAHVMTLLAWDPSQGWGFANTQYQHHNLSWVNEETFAKQWKASGRILIKVKQP